MTNAVFEKKNYWKYDKIYRNIKLVTTEKRRTYLLSKPSYHTTNFVAEHLLAIKMRKTQILMNKPVYLCLSILDLNKTVMYEFWYDHLKLKNVEHAKLFYMGADSFIFHVKTDDIYKDIAEEIETRFDTSNFELDRLLPKWKKKKVIGFMKDEWGGKIIKEFVGLKTKTYGYLKRQQRWK